MAAIHRRIIEHYNLNTDEQFWKETGVRGDGATIFTIYKEGIALDTGTLLELGTRANEPTIT